MSSIKNLQKRTLAAMATRARLQKKLESMNTWRGAGYATFPDLMSDDNPKSLDALGIFNLIRKEKNPDKKVLNALYLLMKHLWGSDGWVSDNNSFKKDYPKEYELLAPYLTIVKLKSSK
jgi:hypothetical protein